MKKKTVITTEKYEVWLIHRPSALAAENEAGSKQAERAVSHVRLSQSGAAGCGEESAKDPVSPEHEERDSLEKTPTAIAGE